MKGYVDLHSHYLPAIDDGVRTTADGVKLLAALRQAGYDTVVATPHIRTAMYDNRRPGLIATYDAFRASPEFIAAGAAMPETGLAAEHFYDDVYWDLFTQDQAMRYPGGFAALVELAETTIPLGLADRVFAMARKGAHFVLAHPERYAPLFHDTDALEPLLDVGVLPLLDLMSLVGRYGRAPQEAALRMLDEGVYYAACSDAHKPTDVPLVAEAIEKLKLLVGAEEAEGLLSIGPRCILEGRVDT